MAKSSVRDAQEGPEVTDSERVKDLETEPGSAQHWIRDVTSPGASTISLVSVRFTFKRPGKARRKKPNRRNCRKKPAGEEEQTKILPEVTACYFYIGTMMNITIRFQYGGQFEVCENRLLYKKASVLTKENLDVDLISKFELELILKEEGNVTKVKELWYLEPGKNLANGLRQLIMHQDVRDMVKNAEMGRIAHVYVVENNDPSPSSLRRKINTSVVEGRRTSQQSGNSSVEVQPRCFLQARINSQNTSNQHEIRGYSIQSDELQYEDGGVVLGSDSSSSDSDFSFVDSEEEDDDIFKEYVDQSVLDDVRRLVTTDDDVTYVEEPELDDGSGELKSGSGTVGGSNTRYPEFNPLVDFRKRITLVTGMIFGSNDIFRRALRQYSIENGGDFYYLHNDNFKVLAYCKYKCDCSINHSRKKCVCKKILCGFKACARRMRLDGSFQLKSFNSEHNCGWQHVNEKATSAWLAEKYIEHYRDDPHWKITAFINTVQRDHKISISYSQGWRARLRAYLMTQGDAKVQYARVWDYAATLIKWNPGSSAYVKVYLDQPEKPLFQRLYVCLDACKRGFLAGCRPIIGLDGCHLKGAYTGQILAAVGKDGNENIFPVAYAVVEAERKETWGWFLENLMRDLGGSILTFMSDRQKGLIEALAQVAPMCDTRVCVRHLYNNFKVKWPGKGFKDAMWAAARASTKFDFDEAMNGIKRLDERAYSYLIQADPSTWSRHEFKHTSKSDMQLNNICESFNSYILQARDKPILTMCEWIRRQLMKRIVSKHEGMSKYVGSLTPKAEKRLQRSKDESLQRCRAHWGGGDRFEVEYFSRIFVVDLKQKSCGCLKWDLTGIPCPHAIACIMMRRLKLEDFVHRYYSTETYLKAYEHMIQPMPGEVDWEKTGMTPPEPPPLVVQPGRPKKTRKKEEGENQPTKQRRLRVGKIKCSHCGEVGHRKNKCNNPPKPPEPPKAAYKYGRPRNPNTVQVTLQSKKKIGRQMRSQAQGGQSSTHDHPLADGSSSVAQSHEYTQVGEGSENRHSQQWSSGRSGFVPLASNKFVPSAPPNISVISSKSKLTDILQRSEKSMDTPTKNDQQKAP